MGWRGQDNRDRDEERERQVRQPRPRYDVISIILFIVMLAAFIFALRSQQYHRAGNSA